MLAGSSFQSSFKNIQLQFELMKYVLDHQRYGRYYGNVPSLLALCHQYQSRDLPLWRHLR